MLASSNPICPECGLELAETSAACPRCALKACFEDEFDHGAPEGSEAILAREGDSARLFGDYELIEEIARGGMGVVFEARQRSLGRVVALKMLLPGRLSNQTSLRRFRAEAEAAARLQHPNIVAIHEVGEYEGQHFYSMDFIPGPDLARRVRSSPVSPEDAARYVRIIAEAIHYAHQRGVLHRDLKPANVLIDAEDQPHVADFGLAKVLDDTRDLTVTGHVLGTPSFMPPEQADPSRGEITVASDVYGLGAILYFLLVGKAPFHAESFELTLLSVLSDDPRPPTQLSASVPRDLETICLKCLSKEPGRRYTSAAELAEDLSRWSRREPIRARPVPRVERIWFWARRNPKLAALSVALVVSLVTGLTLQQLALRKATRARASAEELVQFMNKNLTDTLRPLGRLEMLSNVNAQVRSYYERLPMNEDSPESLVRRAHFHRNTASVLREQGKLSEAESNARTAVAILQPIQKRQPKVSQLATELASAHTVLQQILQDAGDPAAISHAQRAVELSELACRLDGESNEATARLSEARLELGSVLIEAKKFEEAGREIDAGVELIEKLLKTGPNAASWKAQLARGRQYQGRVDQGRNKPDAALGRFKDYLTIFEELTKEEPGNAQWTEGLMSAHADLGFALKERGDFEQALEHFRDYHQLAEELVRRDSSNVGFQRELGFSLEWLAFIQKTQKAPSGDIEEYLSQAHKTFAALANLEPDRDDRQKDSFRSLMNLAEWHRTCGATKAARTLLLNEVTNRWNLLLRSEGRAAASHRRFLSSLEHSEFASEDWTRDQRLQHMRDWLATVSSRAPKQGCEGWWRFTTATLHDNIASLLREKEQFEMAITEFRQAQNLWLTLAAESPSDADLYSTAALTFYNIVKTSLSFDDVRTAIQTTTALLDWSQRQPIARSRAKKLLGALTDLCQEIGEHATSADPARRNEALLLVQRCLKEVKNEAGAESGDETKDRTRLIETAALLAGEPTAVVRSVK